MAPATSTRWRRCRLRAEQRYTRARRALVDVLAAADPPLSLPQLLERGRSLAQSSAYRNLVVLERAGVVHRIVTADEFARYELAEDLTGHHHHLICTQCGDVRDFTVSSDVEADLGRALADVAAEHGFAPTTTGSTSSGAAPPAADPARRGAGRLRPVLREVNGVRINVLDEGEGHPLVFLHGLGGCWRDWEPQLDHLRDRYRVVVIEHRGHGRSERRPATTAPTCSPPTPPPCCRTWASTTPTSSASAWAG